MHSTYETRRSIWESDQSQSQTKERISPWFKISHSLEEKEESLEPSVSPLVEPPGWLLLTGDEWPLHPDREDSGSEAGASQTCKLQTLALGAIIAHPVSGVSTAKCRCGRSLHGLGLMVMMDQEKAELLKKSCCCPAWAFTEQTLLRGGCTHAASSALCGVETRRFPCSCAPFIWDFVMYFSLSLDEKKRKKKKVSCMTPLTVHEHCRLGWLFMRLLWSGCQKMLFFHSFQLRRA